MKKKLLSLLLALCLVMALVPMTAFAEGTSVDNWDGTADTSWYTDHKTDTEYHFTTAEQLAGLAQLVNDKTASVSFEGKTIYLDNDLDLSGIQWTPIGNGNNFVRHFAGTFDGQHHKIMNLYHHYTGDELVRNGLFGVVSDGGTLKNLLVIDADIASNDGSLLAGILADWVNGGTVENCYTSGKIENNVGDKFVGGLIGQCTWSTQVKGCASDATVISTESDEDHVDTVGGLIGQWENSADSSSITDCWFGGSVSCNNIYSAVGGILGANFENFSGNKPGVIIKNCIVATKNITGAEPGNITWITAVVKTHVTDCIWPDTPPDGVTLDEETYPDNKGNYLAVAKLVVDWDAGTAGADPTFDQSSCGTAVSNFTSADVLAGLQTNAGAGVEWVAGIGHPTFVWDDNNIPADYTAVDAAIVRATALDSSLYTNYSAVEDSINSVDRAKSKAQQTEVDAMAKAIEDAVSALQYKDADYTKVDAAIAQENALNKDNYKDFSGVEDAVNAVVRDKNITEQAEVDAMAKAIEDAIAALQYKDADYTKVDEAIAKANALNKDNYKDFTAVEAAVKAVVRDKNITEQSEVDAMAKAIEDAIAALQYKDADYTKVDAAIAKANALKKDDYKDFSGVEAAVKAVVRDKNITEQSEVDAMAKAIEDAINALVWKSSGGGSSSPSYSVTIPNKTENGTVTVSPRSAEKGDTVTITAKPDSGYQLDDLTVTDKNGKELKLTDKGNGKYTFTMPASKVEIKATFVKEVETSPFSDVSTSAYYYEAVKWAQEKGITGGIGNGLFGPNQPCTRAQIVTFLWRAAGSPEPKSMSSFSDVSADSYYAKAVAWAVENGITTGTGDGKFSPDATCTREQAVAFLYRASGSPAVSGGSAFSDVAANAYYADAVAWAEKNGVTGGIGGGLFGSGNTCTRAQIVTFLYRAYQGK